MPVLAFTGTTGSRPPDILGRRLSGISRKSCEKTPFLFSAYASDIFKRVSYILGGFGNALMRKNGRKTQSSCRGSNPGTLEFKTVTLVYKQRGRQFFEANLHTHFLFKP